MTNVNTIIHNMKNQTKTILAIVAVVAAIGLAATTVATSNLAYAKISSVDTSCSNGGGNEPGGQQPTCTGGGLTQESENQNPSGSAPPGQNK
jgi:Spy/CpxP family protein refolding chaperone